MREALKALVRAARQLGSRAKVRRLLRERAPLRVEVGAGARRGREGWVTLDLARGCDVYWDLRRGMPFPDGSVAKVYSSHFLEHLTFREGQRFLDECLRVLVPGGVFSICVPDARRYLEAYVRGEALPAEFFGYAPAFNNTTRIDYANHIAYMDGQHRYMFDAENLVHRLAARGFRNARLRAFDPALDLAERDFHSLYAEAEKPG